MTIGGGDLDSIYRVRFGEGEAAGKLELWTPIVDFLSRWIPPDGAVLDVACDRGYFIRNVTARERWATDIRDLGGAFDASCASCRWTGWSSRVRCRRTTSTWSS